MGLGRRFGRFGGLLALGWLAACAQPRIPYGEAEASRAVIPGFASVRTWADKPDAAFLKMVRATRDLAGRSGRAVTYLALSGGGGDGAYGAGALNGWSETGTRPTFTIVSGVSTGALIAPFAYLGSAYDDTLRELYTSGVAETIVESPDPIGAVFGPSLFSNDRLRQLVSRYVTPEMVAEIARERARGRLLLVLTTNLDSQRPVLWDMGAIAAQGSPRSVELFRDVLVASASIPAVFPPILFDAQADGRGIQEMHVDGTVTASIFTLPRSYLDSDATPAGGRKTSLFIIMNSKIDPDFTVVANTAAAIVPRSVSTLIREQAHSDLVDTLRVARRSGIAVRLSAIDRDVPASTGAGFSTRSMRRLYDLGLEKARSGRLWQSTVVSSRQEASAVR